MFRGSASLAFLFYPHVPRGAACQSSFSTSFNPPKENYRQSPVLTRLTRSFYFQKVKKKKRRWFNRFLKKRKKERKKDQWESAVWRWCNTRRRWWRRLLRRWKRSISRTLRLGGLTLTSLRFGRIVSSTLSLFSTESSPSSLWYGSSWFWIIS